MKYLKTYKENLETNSIINIMEFGFKQLIRNTHLVGEQVKLNMYDFLSDLDVQKFENKFGKIIEFLGAGVFGAVFALENGKVLKITFDFHEAPFLYKYCLHGKTEGFVDVDSVYKIDFGSTSAYIIVRDELEQVFNNFKYLREYKDEIEIAKQSMYNIDPNWRDTHLENLGIQNGKVVLYDGFSKNAEVDEKSIPKLNI